jgi:hypothetical protein
MFTAAVIWIVPEQAATLHLNVTGATGVFPDSTKEVEVMTTFGLLAELLAAATPVDPVATRMIVPRITVTAINIRAAQARACMDRSPVLMANRHKARLKHDRRTYCVQRPLVDQSTLLGFGPILLEGIARDVRNAVDHLVADLPLVDEAHEVPGRHTELASRFGCSEQIS